MSVEKLDALIKKNYDGLKLQVTRAGSRLGCTADEASEALVDSYLSLRGANLAEIVSDVRPLVVRKARFLMIDDKRRQGRIGKILNIEEHGEIRGDAAASRQVLCDEVKMIYKKVRDDFTRACPDFGEALRLRVHEERTLREIAQAVLRPEYWVKDRCKAFRQRLVVVFSQAGYEDWVGGAE